MIHGTLFHTKIKNKKKKKKKIRKVRKEKIWKHAILGKAISVRGNAKNENVRSETASDFHCQIGYKRTTNDWILMK